MNLIYSNTMQPIRQKGKHLTSENRAVIEYLHRQGYSNRHIARELNCSPATIGNELKRGTAVRKHLHGRGRHPVYKAKRGQQQYKRNRSHCRRSYLVETSAVQPFLTWVVERITQAKWSFETCRGYALLHNLFPEVTLPSVKTLYNAIWRDKAFLKRFHFPLLLRRARKKPTVRPHRRLRGRSIDERPAHVKQCTEFGHWEIDTVLAQRARGAVLCTLVEKKTRYTIAAKIPSKTRAGITAFMTELIAYFGSRFVDIFKSITADNGREFDGLSEYESLGTHIYYAHPYSSWERGQNERMNRELRRYFPKKQSLDAVSAETVEE